MAQAQVQHFFEHHHLRCSKSIIKGIMLHPKQPRHHSNISDYSGQSRTQSQRRTAAASFPREGNTFSFGVLFVFSNQRPIGSLLLRASQRHAASARSPISLVLLLPKIALFICEQPQLEPGYLCGSCHYVLILAVNKIHSGYGNNLFL